MSVDSKTECRVKVICRRGELCRIIIATINSVRRRSRWYVAFVDRLIYCVWRYQSEILAYAAAAENEASNEASQQLKLAAACRTELAA